MLFFDFRGNAPDSCDYYKIIALCYKLRNNFVTKRKQCPSDLICGIKSVIMPADKQEKEWKMKHTSIIILITSVVVCGALAGITAAAKIPSPPSVLPSPTPEATLSPPVQELNRIGFCEGAGGNYTKNGDMLYFIQEDGAIACAPVRGGETVRLTQAGNRSWLNVIGNRLYWIETNGIYTMELSQGEETKLSSLSATKLEVRADGAYYLCSGAIWYCSLSGENEQLIYNGAADFMLCSDLVIAARENPEYGFDLISIGSEEPFITRAAAFTVLNDDICAITDSGVVFASAPDLKTVSAGAGFERLPQSIAICSDGLLYVPRGEERLVLRARDGTEQTVLRGVQSPAVIEDTVIFRRNGELYCCLCSGWGIRRLSDGLPEESAEGKLECSVILLEGGKTSLQAGESTYLTVVTDSVSAGAEQLEQLALLIKDETVIKAEIAGDRICITALEAGNTIFRAATAQKNVFAELLFTVE